MLILIAEIFLHNTVRDEDKKKIRKKFFKKRLNQCDTIRGMMRHPQSRH